MSSSRDQQKGRTMTGIQELIARQRAADAPPEPIAPEPEPPKMSERLSRLVAAQKAHIENTWDDVDVMLGGEIVTVSIGHLWPDDWGNLTAYNPARAEVDKPYGYNRAAVAREYVTDRLKLDGEPTDVDTWHAVWDLLRGDDPTNVEAVMWWQHVGQPQDLLSQHRAEGAEVTLQVRPQG